VELTVSCQAACFTGLSGLSLRISEGLFLSTEPGSAAFEVQGASGVDQVGERGKDAGCGRLAFSLRGPRRLFILGRAIASGAGNIAALI
jgi:hypothetical protein